MQHGTTSLTMCHTLRLQLNPMFVEWLMGWPLGWTDCAYWGMALSQAKPQQPSGSSQPTSGGTNKDTGVKMTSNDDRPEWWSSDEWTTPQEIVDELAVQYGPFDLDACARADTAKAPLYYAQEHDGLQQAWEGRVWLNPPYSKPGPWCQKAIEETQAGRAELVVALLPAATDTGWFHDYVKTHAELHFRRGRIKFLGWRGTPIGSPKQGSIIAIYRRPA